jgi:hypothetical protein
MRLPALQAAALSEREMSTCGCRIALMVFLEFEEFSAASCFGVNINM